MTHAKRDSADPDGALPDGITRAVLERDGLRRAMEIRHPDIPLRNDDAIRDTLRETLARGPVGVRSGVWVFAYGSLLWNPCVEVAERAMARLYGFHRDFQLKLTYARGSPDAPGMMLGLVPGGSCRGVALRVVADDLEQELMMVWRREMLTGVYKPRWVDLHTDDSRHRTRAIAFVVDPTHRGFCGRLGDDAVIELLATGRGVIGSSADYLINTVEHLEASGIHDRRLCALRRAVIAHPGQTPRA